ncbi:MAG: dipeptidase [Dehalococcoidia bacterium]
MSTIAADPVERPNKGFHPVLDEPIPYLFVDGCMQAWRDADYANAHRHGVTAYGVTAILPRTSEVDIGRTSDSTLERAIDDVMFFHLVAHRFPNVLVATTAADIRRARQEDRAALFLCAQDGDWLGRQLHRIEALYRLGLRVMLPVYNASNQIGAGCLDREDSGLTRFGEFVVDECNRLGLLLDGSHVGRRTTLDMMERSSRPVVFTHANVDALCPSPRNVTDDQIRACVATDGVIGVANFGPFLLKEGHNEQPTVDDLIEHIDYLAQMTGSTHHIGIGTDMSLGTYPLHAPEPWGTPAYTPAGSDYARLITNDARSPRRALRDFNCYPQVMTFVERLLSRGYQSEDVHKILGGNFLRVFEQVWR